MAYCDIDFSTYETLDDVAHDNAVGDRLYDDYGAWLGQQGWTSGKEGYGEQWSALQKQFLAQYRAALR